MAKKPITEENNQADIDQWYKDAKTMKRDQLLGFFDHLSMVVINDYHHDYGTICHAVAAVAVAAANAMNQEPTGGITEFQSNAVMWMFIRYWTLGGKGPMRLMKYEDALYPQSIEHGQFDCRIVDEGTAQYLQAEATKNLKEHGDECHPAVKKHWELLASGKLPAGWKVQKD